MALDIPTAAEVPRLLREFHERPGFALVENSLSMLFAAWPKNTDLREVHLKVVALNAMYSTQIYDTSSVSSNIYRHDIDAALQAGDLSLVEKIALTPLKGGKSRFNRSFASKYCSWHAPDAFAIYDSYVEEALWHFQKIHAFTSFKRKDLGSYIRFMEVVDAFAKSFGLEEFSKKQLDQCLWVLGARLRGA